MKRKEHKTFNIDVKASLEKLQEYRKVRWEFLRLNSAYRFDYDALEKEKNEVVGKMKHYAFEKWLYRKHKEFSKKWLIMPHDYRKDIPPLSTDPFYEPIMLCASNMPNVGAKCGLVQKGVAVKNNILTATFQTSMGIQINPFFSKSLTLGIIKWMLDGLEYEKEITLTHSGNPTAKNRMRLQDYYEFLKVYKFKTDNPKMTYEEIAGKLCGRTGDKLKDGDIQTVYKRYKKAKKLVQQGIRGFPPTKINLVSPTHNR